MIASSATVQDSGTDLSSPTSQRSNAHALLPQKPWKQLTRGTVGGQKLTTTERDVSSPSTVFAPKSDSSDVVATPLAEWQGYVTSIEGTQFHARLEGIYGTSVIGQTHDAVIPMAEVSASDKQLVREGAYFRLSVSYIKTRNGNGTSRRESAIVFRRLPAYVEADLVNARENARELVSGLRLE